MKRRLLLEKKVMTNLDSILKSRDHYIAKKGLSSQGYGFSSGHVWIWELDCEESWAPKNWCFWTVLLEKTLESPLDCKEIQPVHPLGDQSWVFIGRTDAEAETPILWPPHSKSWLTGKVPDAWRDWGQEEKGATEAEVAGWHHQLVDMSLSLGVGDGQGGLVCCNSWGRKELETSDWTKNGIYVNNSFNNIFLSFFIWSMWYLFPSRKYDQPFCLSTWPQMRWQNVYWDTWHGHKLNSLCR